LLLKVQLGLPKLKLGIFGAAICTGWMTFLSPNQNYQNIKGKSTSKLATRITCHLSLTTSCDAQHDGRWQNFKTIM